MAKVSVDFEMLESICRRAHSDEDALKFALEWAEEAEKLALQIQAERDKLLTIASKYCDKDHPIDWPYVMAIAEQIEVE